MPTDPKDSAGEEQEMPSRQTLEAEYGPLISGPALARLLGYRSGAAFRKATQRDKLPVHTFTLPNRQGRFARAVDVARWLAALPAAPEPAPTKEEL